MITLFSSQSNDFGSATACCLPPAVSPDDPLALHLHSEHQKRYERIKAWRENQCDPYFTEVTPGWRREFRRQATDGRRQQTQAEF